MTMARGAVISGHSRVSKEEKEKKRKKRIEEKRGFRRDEYDRRMNVMEGRVKTPAIYDRICNVQESVMMQRNRVDQSCT